MIEKIDQDLKQAILNHESDRVMLLRGLKSSLKNEQIKKQSELSKQDVIAVLKRESKQRQESAQMFTQGGAEDKANKEKWEKEIIDSYLPAQMSESELIKIIDEHIKKIGNDKSKMGAIIGAVISSSEGRADGSEISRIVKEKLS